MDDEWHKSEENIFGAAESWDETWDESQAWDETQALDETYQEGDPEASPKTVLDDDHDGEEISDPNLILEGEPGEPCNLIRF